MPFSFSINKQAIPLGKNPAVPLNRNRDRHRLYSFLKRYRGFPIIRQRVAAV
jgi:hypothetical protein